MENRKPKTSTFFFRPTGGPRRGARTTAFFSGVKSWWREGSEQGPPAARRLAPTRGADCLLTWSLVFSDSDELSEFSSSDGDMLAWSRSLDAFRARLEADIFKADAFRFRPLFSLLLSESESLSILSLVAAAVTAVTAMTPRASSSSLPPAGSASGASLSEELTG